MTTRGVHKPGVSMVTSRMLGAFRDNPETRREFAGDDPEQPPDDGGLTPPALGQRRVAAVASLGATGAVRRKAPHLGGRAGARLPPPSPVTALARGRRPAGRSLAAPAAEGEATWPSSSRLRSARVGGQVDGRRHSSPPPSPPPGGGGPAGYRSASHAGALACRTPGGARPRRRPCLRRPFRLAGASRACAACMGRRS